MGDVQVHKFEMVARIPGFVSGTRVQLRAVLRQGKLMLHSTARLGPDANGCPCTRVAVHIRIETPLLSEMGALHHARLVQAELSPYATHKEQVEWFDFQCNVFAVQQGLDYILTRPHRPLPRPRKPKKGRT